MKYINCINTKQKQIIFKLFIRFLKDNKIFNYNNKNIAPKQQSIIIAKLNFYNEQKDYKGMMGTLPYIFNIMDMNTQWDNYYTKYLWKINKTQLFIKFLKNNNIYKQFITNLNNSTIIRVNEKMNINKYINTQQIYNLIENAFLWKNTQQNYNFWLKLDNKWKNNIINIHKQWIYKNI